MKTPIRLKTISGVEEYEMLHRYREKCGVEGLKEFKQKCHMESIEVNSKLKYFLEDDVMARKYKMDDEDVEGWQIFNEYSDRVSILNYFCNEHVKGSYHAHN